MKRVFFDKKTTFIGILTVLVVALSAICALVPVEKRHEPSSERWMKGLNDSAYLCDLSIPGTHDSGATHSIFDVSGKCQDISIKKQLQIGVRFFDLRLQLINDEFQIVHSFVKQNLKFSETVKDFCEFLSQNPSEFLLLSIKKEADSQNSTLSFEDALNKELSPLSNAIYGGDKLPQTVGEVRGRAIIISRSVENMGIPASKGWIDDDSFDLGELYVQDNYNVSEIVDKKQSVISALEYAQGSSGTLVLNFTSCYLSNAFPPTYAGSAALEINPWLMGYLKNYNGKTGVIVADFITQDLAKAIYGRNFK